MTLAALRRPFKHDPVENYAWLVDEAKHDVWSISKAVASCPAPDLLPRMREKLTEANSNLRRYERLYARSVAARIEFNTTATADKEIEKWKKSLTKSKPSSTSNSQNSTLIRYEPASSFFSFTGFSRRCMVRLKGGRVMRLLFLAVMLEILYYLPRFIVLVLHKLGGS